MTTDRDALQMDPLYDKKVQCHFCGKTIQTKKIRSKFVKPLRIESDFCQVFEPGQMNPLHYYVVVCPECSFAFTDDFASFISARVRPAIQQTLDWFKGLNSKNYCGQRTPEEVIETYNWCLRVAEQLKEKSITFADLYIRLAWLF